MLRYSRNLVGLALLLFVLCLTGFIFDNEASAAKLKVEPAPEWDVMFKRTSGWLGADGVYTIPLNGYRQIGAGNSSTRTYWGFADTNVGTVNPSTFQFTNLGMVNNSAALMTGTSPNPANISYVYGNDGDLTNSNLYGANNEIIWPSDGIRIGNNLYIFGVRVDSGMISQEIVGIRVPLVAGEPDFPNMNLTRNVPLLYKEYNANGDVKTLIQFGAAIYDNTVSGGGPNPDGYVYIYGIRVTNADDFFTRKQNMVVARVPKADFTDLNEWRFYNNGNWVTNMLSVNNEWANRADHVSFEYSVSYINSGIHNGKYMAVYSHKQNTNIIAYRLGDTPYGPFGDEVHIYTAPEPRIYQDSYPGEWVLTYNAKAHPHLSASGELLISYSPNVLGVFTTTSELYRPRFIKLKLNELAPEPPYRPEINIALGKTTTASHSSAYAPRAVDGQWSNWNNHKWVALGSGQKWLQVDLGQSYEITRWIVRHAGEAGEPASYNTRDFRLQLSEDGSNWVTVDVVSENKASLTNREIIPNKARYARLLIDAATQSADQTARIYEFEVYSPDQTNVALNKATNASHSAGTSNRAVDGNDTDIYNDKWVGWGTGPKWISVDLGQNTAITRWVVKHASFAGEATAMNTQNFRLQRYNGSTWVDVDVVTNNTAEITSRDITSTTGRYFRLYIDKPEQGNGDIARIFEFELYRNN